jgi:prepilin-type N-terminal cleavage/methylation domain-containing protein
VGREVRRSRSGGYTLIEIVVVVAVLAVASAAVAPAVGRALDGVKVRTEVAGIASFLRWARQQAVTRGESQEVSLDTEARALLFRRAGGEAVAAVETRRQLSPLLHIAPASSLLPQSITFMPQGRSSGGSFRIEAVGPRVYIVTVDPLTGRVTTQRVDS